MSTAKRYALSGASWARGPVHLVGEHGPVAEFWVVDEREGLGVFGDLYLLALCERGRGLAVEDERGAFVGVVQVHPAVALAGENNRAEGEGLWVQWCDAHAIDAGGDDGSACGEVICG